MFPISGAITAYATLATGYAGTSWKGKLKLAVDSLIPQVSDFKELLIAAASGGL